MAVYLRLGHSYTFLPQDEFALPQVKIQGGTNTKLSLNGVQYIRKYVLRITILSGGHPACI